MAGYPKIKMVTPLSGRRLRVTFATGDAKVTCSPLLGEEPFGLLKDEAFFATCMLTEQATELFGMTMWI